MAGGGEVDKASWSPVEALISADAGEVKGGKVEAGEAAHVHFVGGESGCCADGVVARALGMWELNIPVSLLFVADHGELEGHGVVGTLNTAVGALVVETGGNLIDDEAVVEGEGELRAKLESVVGCRANGHPQRGIYWSTRVDKAVGRAGGGGVSLCSCVHVGAAVEVARKKENVGIVWRHLG